MSGFFKTVEQAVSGNSTLVIGNTKTGKTHWIITQLLKTASSDVLWVSFDNLNFENQNLSTWQVGTPESWTDFEKNVIMPVRSKELHSKVMVVEGLDVAGEFYRKERLAKLGAEFTRQIFGEVGPKLRETIAILRNGCDTLYLSMATKSKVDVTGVPSTSFTMNADAITKIMNMCPNVVYTSSKPERDPKGVITGTGYYVQENSNLAMNFTNGSKS